MRIRVSFTVEIDEESAEVVRMYGDLSKTDLRYALKADAEDKFIDHLRACRIPIIVNGEVEEQ